MELAQNSIFPDLRDLFSALRVRKPSAGEKPGENSPRIPTAKQRPRVDILIVSQRLDLTSAK